MSAGPGGARCRCASSTITLAASGALVLTFGLVVGSLITNGLVSARTASAQAAVDEGSEYAKAQLNVQIAGPDDGFASNTIAGVLRALASRENGLTVAIVAGVDPADPGPAI